jgi:cephalosporin hydroxylase
LISKGNKQILEFLKYKYNYNSALAGIKAYAHLTSDNGYCIVFDALNEDVPADMFLDRSWGPGNIPKTAIREYIDNYPKLIIDMDIQSNYLITAAPDIYLKLIK